MPNDNWEELDEYLKKWNDWLPANLSESTLFNLRVHVVKYFRTLLEKERLKAQEIMLCWLENEQKEHELSDETFDIMYKNIQTQLKKLEEKRS